ncbi:MAG: glycosyltransferase family 39 protein, partial [Candidatus Sumerlaeia bacterium]|nr:glycosyltransferase family 39 protein [Candidatus Sumerlaeia bacterium]
MVTTGEPVNTHTKFIALMFLLLAVVVAAILRLVGLDQSPPGLFRDELEKGYTALQLWSTGRHGILGAEGVQRSPLLPIFIEVFEGHDRTSAIYQYITAPFVGMGGLNYWTTRLPAALAGILGVLAVGGFAWRLIGPAAGVTAALLLAIHPTGVLFSRWAQQGILQAMLVPAGFWLLLEAERARVTHRRALGVVGAFVLVVAAWAYDPGRLVIPLMLAVWVLWRMVGLNREDIRPYLKTFLPAVVLFALLWIPLAVYTVGPGGGRLGRVGVGGLGPGEMVMTTITNNFSFRTPGFWIVEGDSNMR